MKITTRKEALAQGLKRYFTGKPCKRGHVAERNDKGTCVVCRKAYSQSEKSKAYQKAYQKVYSQTEKDKTRQKAYQKVYSQTEKGKTYQKAYHQSEEGTAAALRRTLGFTPPVEYVEAVHAGRLIKRELKKLKEQNI